MAITAYKVIESVSADELSAAVVEAIGDGWQPQGAPVVREKAGITSHVYAQAMVQGTVDGGGSGPSEITSDDITDASTVGKNVLKATDAAAARTAIGAGTSSLAVGSTAGSALAASAAAGTASTAARSDHVHALPSSTALQVAAITTSGGQTIPAGSLQATLQAIANLASPTP